MRSFFSNSTTSWPARASCCAQAIPAGPDPITTTRFPVFAAGGCGSTHPSSQPLSMMKCSIDLMPTGLLLMLSVHASSHGAGQILPPLVPVYEVVPVGNDVVHRTTGLAERDAAVHAARTLLRRFVVLERED